MAMAFQNLPRMSGRLPLLLAAVCLAGTVLTVIWKFTPVGHYLDPHHLAPVLKELRYSLWAVPAVLALYVVGCSLFFPLTLLILTTSLAFPSWEAFGLALSGALSSACFGYTLGRYASRKLVPPEDRSLRHKITVMASSGGVLGVTLVRMVPIAPLGVVDFTLGISKIPFRTYFAGTFLGLLPGIATLSFLGTSLAKLWQDRSWESLAPVLAGLAAWILIVFISHSLLKRSERNAVSRSSRG